MKKELRSCTPQTELPIGTPVSVSGYKGKIVKNVINSPEGLKKWELNI